MYEEDVCRGTPSIGIITNSGLVLHHTLGHYLLWFQQMASLCTQILHISHWGALQIWSIPLLKWSMIHRLDSSMRWISTFEPQLLAWKTWSYAFWNGREFSLIWRRPVPSVSVVLPLPPMHTSKIGQKLPFFYVFCELQWNLAIINFWIVKKLSLVNKISCLPGSLYTTNHMLNSKNLTIVKSLGDKTEFTIARFHCISILTAW